MTPDQEIVDMASVTKTAVRARNLSLFKAMSHPLRAEILTLLTERGEPVSPIEMSRIFGAPVGDVSHHCKQLVKYECAEQVGTRQRRGATEHFYRATARPHLDDHQWRRMPGPARAAFSEHIVGKQLDDKIIAFEAGTLDAREDRYLTRMPMTLDEKGWEEMYEIMDAAFEKSFEVQARSDERRRENGEAGIKVSASLACFEMP
jgi:DNA-binding transcriptional ArsR family regulator